MEFEIVEHSILKIFKVSIRELVSLAEHYYLAEFPSLHNSVSWGPNGLELRGKVRITSQEMERVNKFMGVSKL